MSTVPDPSCDHEPSGECCLLGGLCDGVCNGRPNHPHCDVCAKCGGYVRWHWYDGKPAQALRDELYGTAPTHRI